MSDKLICGCGGEVEIQHSYSKLAAKIFYYAECPVCGLQISTRYSKKYDSKEELSSAFRKATRADIKQGIQFSKTEKAILQVIMNNDTVESLYDVFPEFGDIVKKINLPEDK
jgi:hypothetical protein